MSPLIEVFLVSQASVHVYNLSVCLQATEWGSSAWRLGDSVYERRSSLLCGSQHPNHNFQWPPHWKVLRVRANNNHLYCFSFRENVASTDLWPLESFRSFSTKGPQIAYERSFRWKLAHFRYLCQVGVLFLFFCSVTQLNFVILPYWYLLSVSVQCSP